MKSTIADLRQSPTKVTRTVVVSSPRLKPEYFLKVLVRWSLISGMYLFLPLYAELKFLPIFTEKISGTALIYLTHFYTFLYACLANF